MNWDTIKSIQKETDLRLILPFGLALEVGDVISVDRNGEFTLEGSCASLLGIDPGTPRPDSGNGQVNYSQVSGDKTTCTFRLAGAASTLFPDLPTAKAGFDINFTNADSWVLAYTDRSLSTMENVNRFRERILDTFKRGVWQPDWALVTEVATAGRMTLLASRTRNTKVAISLSGTVDANAALEVQLTAGASVERVSNQIIQCITGAPRVVACRALRVQDHWWRNPEIGSLDHALTAEDPRTAPDAKFWEDVDDLRIGGRSVR